MTVFGHEDDLALILDYATAGDTTYSAEELMCIERCVNTMKQLRRGLSVALDEIWEKRVASGEISDPKAMTLTIPEWLADVHRGDQ